MDPRSIACTSPHTTQALNHFIFHGVHKIKLCTEEFQHMNTVLVCRISDPLPTKPLVSVDSISSLESQTGLILSFERELVCEQGHNLTNCATETIVEILHFNEYEV